MLSFWKLCPIFLEGDPLGQFGISQVGDEWRIFSRKTLDREQMAKYLLRITASDGKFQASVLLEIFVLDINDNSPQCSQVRAWGAVGWKWRQESWNEGKEEGEELRGPSLRLAIIDHTCPCFSLASQTSVLDKDHSR